MKTIYLVRHAKSSWKHDDLTDFQRPLNKRGNNDAPRMGELLQERGINPDVLVSSPAVRAITTAKIIAKELGYSNNNILEIAAIYEASPQTLLDRVIGETKPKFDSLMMFGHNPGFTMLAELLTNEHLGNVPTCGVVTIRCEVDSWKEISYNSGILSAFDYPKRYW